MKNKRLILCLRLLLSGAFPVSAQSAGAAGQTGNPKPVMQDYGPAPIVLNIETLTVENENFRTALWTGTRLQTTLMSIPVGGDVGLECHPETDQFLRIEQGEARVLIGDSRDVFEVSTTAGPDHAIFVPAGKWHNIVNTGNIPLKLYSIYTPIEHPRGTVHRTQQEALEAESHH